MNFVSHKGAKYRQDAKGHFASFVFIPCLPGLPAEGMAGRVQKKISNEALIATRKLIMLRYNSQISLMNTDFKIHICENLCNL